METIDKTQLAALIMDVILVIFVVVGLVKILWEILEDL